MTKTKEKSSKKIVEKLEVVEKVVVPTNGETPQTIQQVQLTPEQIARQARILECVNKVNKIIKEEYPELKTTIGFTNQPQLIQQFTTMFSQPYFIQQFLQMLSQQHIQLLVT